jgi:hypothetical protein
VGAIDQEEIIATRPFVLANSLAPSSNLSDLTNPAAARSNLGLDTANAAGLSNGELFGTTTVNGDIAMSTGDGRNTYTFTSDPTAGMYLEERGVVSFASSNNEGVLHVGGFDDSGGSYRSLVDIGNPSTSNGTLVQNRAPTNPNCLLRVRPLSIDQANNGGVEIGSINGNTPYVGANIGYTTASGYQAFDLHFRTSNTTRMKIEGGGKVKCLGDLDVADYKFAVDAADNIIVQSNVSMRTYSSITSPFHEVEGWYNTNMGNNDQLGIVIGKYPSSNVGGSDRGFMKYRIGASGNHAFAIGKWGGAVMSFGHNGDADSDALASTQTGIIKAACEVFDVTGYLDVRAVYINGTSFITNFSAQPRFTHSLLPNAIDAYDLGDATLRWRNLYVANIYGGVAGLNLDSRNSMIFMIDSDNSDAGSSFVWRKHGTADNMMELNQDGTLAFPNLIGRKINLWSDSYGFGISPNTLDYWSATNHDFYHANTLRFRINNSGGATVSDDRIKSHERVISNAMDTLNKLRPETYLNYFSIDHDASDSNAGTYEAGLVAQEIFYGAPELRHLVDVPSTADSNALYHPDSNIPPPDDPADDPDYSAWGSNIAMVNYTGLIPYLIAALKEKDADIADLKARLATIENIIKL